MNNNHTNYKTSLSQVFRLSSLLSFYLLLGFVLIIFRLDAQNKSHSDSLQHLFISDSTFTPEERLNLAISLIDIFSKSIPAKADEYTLAAIEIATYMSDNKKVREFNLILATSKNDQCEYSNADIIYQSLSNSISDSDNPQETANLYYLIADNYFDWSKYDESDKYFNIALQEFTRIKDKYGVAKSHIGLSAIASTYGDYEKAIGHMQLARDIYTEVNDPQSLTKTALGIGTILESLGNYERALAYYKQAYEGFNENEDKLQEINMLLHIGDILLKQKKYTEALAYFNEATQLEKTNSNQKLRSICYSNLGEVYYAIKEYDTALNFQEKSLEIKYVVGDKKRIAISLLSIGKIYFAQKNNEFAEQYILNSLNLAKEIGYKNVEMESLLLLAKINKEKSNFSVSYEYLTEYISLKDTLLNLDNQSMINNLTVKYESERYEKENEILRQKDSITTLELEYQKSTKLFAIAFLIFIVVISLIIILFIHLKSIQNRKNYAVLAKKNKEITEQKESLSELNKNLEYSKEQFKSIVENATIGMYQTHKDGSILYANSGLIKMLGFNNMSELAKVNLNAYKTRKSFINLLEEKHIISGRQDVWKRKDGSSMYVNESAWIAKNKDGETTHFEGIVEDITKRKEAEVALKQSKIDLQNINSELETKNKEFELAKNQAIAANEIKSQFIANVSHEIRTPMNSILGFTDLLGKLITEKKQLSYIGAIKSSSISLLALINDILDLSKIQAGEIEIIYEPISFEMIFVDIERMFKLKLQEKNLSFKSVIDHNIPKTLFLDKVRIMQILTNLVGNAIKFTDRGIISLEITGKRITDYIDLQISIADSGIGISELEHSTIFEAFKQSKTRHENSGGGTGLGLSITKRLIEVMGGSISVNSEVGKGSNFIISLPNIEIASDDTQTSQNNSIKDIYESSDKITNKLAHDFKFDSSIDIDEDVRKKLVIKYMIKWEVLNRNHIINEIVVFGQELLEFSKKENNTYLTKFSEALIFYSNNYDIEMINKLLELMGKIIKSENKS